MSKGKRSCGLKVTVKRKNKNWNFDRKIFERKKVQNWEWAYCSWRQFRLARAVRSNCGETCSGTPSNSWTPKQEKVFFPRSKSEVLKLLKMKIYSFWPIFGCEVQVKWITAVLYVFPFPENLINKCETFWQIYSLKYKKTLEKMLIWTTQSTLFHRPPFTVHLIPTMILFIGWRYFLQFFSGENMKIFRYWKRLNQLAWTVIHIIECSKWMLARSTQLRLQACFIWLKKKVFFEPK